MNYLVVSQHTVYGETKRFFADLDRALLIYRNAKTSRWNTKAELFCQIRGVSETPWIPMADMEGA